MWFEDKIKHMDHGIITICTLKIPFAQTRLLATGRNEHG